jgi:hypothetical protein
VRHKAGPAPSPSSQFAADKQIEPTMADCDDRFMHVREIAETIREPCGTLPRGTLGFVTLAAIEKPDSARDHHPGTRRQAYTRVQTVRKTDLSEVAIELNGLRSGQ